APDVTYSWSPAAGLSSTSVSAPVATPDLTTTYQLKVTDQFGCADSVTVRIRLRNQVAAKAVINGSKYLCPPEDSARFESAGTGKILHWNWSFGNGATDTAAVPAVQQYVVPGNNTDITVRLVVTDTSGCSDTAYHVLQIVDNCYIAVPSAFTPNGDGINDYLYPLNAYKASDLRFSVFNRQGELMFTTTDWTHKWDGTRNGILQATGVYVWTLAYKNERGRSVFLKGTVTLIR
ncbi:MAG TPA: gliding motility-associated C-terminal domain-containing protein, partial [Chitinophagaceae bacterium]